jgi:hypothetical protein
MCVDGAAPPERHDNTAHTSPLSIPTATTRVDEAGVDGGTQNAFETVCKSWRRLRQDLAAAMIGGRDAVVTKAVPFIIAVATAVAPSTWSSRVL